MIGHPPKTTLFPYHPLSLSRIENEERYDPPLPDEEVEQIARSISRYPPAGRHLTDVGNAERLADRFGQDIRYVDRKSTCLNSSHANISYAVFCLKKKKKNHY